MQILERNAAISGIGQSEIGRPLDKSGLELTLDACLKAIADAGLDPKDIDGLASWPGFLDSGTPGMSPVPLLALKDALGLQLNWYCAGSEMPAQTAAVINACAAVATGLARHVICFRTLTEASSQTKERRASVVGSGGSRISGQFQWQIPFRAMSAANWIGMFAQRHFHEFGTTREQLAQIALNDRKNAALNPDAIFRDPLSMEDYLNARTISTPFGLFDCDVPIDGSVAVIISHIDTVKDLKCPSLRVEAVGSALHGKDSWDQFDDLTTMSARDAAKMLWSRTDLKPNDVDVAELYDGFSFLTIAWLEALGFCPHGEGGRFIEGGESIARNGQIPLNTNGGQLSAGRIHGYGLLYEACVQLRGEAGERQVKDAQVAAVGAGGGPGGSCLLLTAL